MTERQQKWLHLNSNDNVAIALFDLEAGEVISPGLALQSPVGRGHKLALQVIPEDRPVVKYGQVIGFASETIQPGQWVHGHNCTMGEFTRDYAVGAGLRNVEPIESQRTFEGFRRADGRVGTRNYIAVLTSVNCSASVARFAAEMVNRSGVLADYPNVDGVVPFVHGTGCGMSMKGEGYENLQRALWGYAAHPNFAGVLMIGLGCEVFQIPHMMETYGLTETESFQVMTIQESGGTRKSVEAAAERIKAMLPAANRAVRTPVEISEIKLGLQCGGSDGYSGITANPALGAASDLLVRHGGTAVLSETPEIYGAEHLLTRRAVSQKVADKLLERIAWWKDYTARNGGELDNNPSPGNKAGGLTTILEKSLGAVAKGGTMPLTDVYLYGEQLRAPGFAFMDSPGYDPCSVTGQVASGCNVICFTTGRGSVFGCKPSPSIKLATNTPMYQSMSEDMDINCGTIAEGVHSVEEKGQEILDLVIEVASGRRSRSEELGFGDNEFVPWQIGAVM